MRSVVRSSFSKKISLLLPVLAIASVGVCQAGNLYFQGFETDTSGWYDYSTSAPGGVARVAGTVGMPAADGNYYGQVTDVHDKYQPGYGGGGYTLFGNTTTGPLPYPGGPFTQSMDIYINPLTPAPTVSPTTAAFWLDASPSSTDPADNTVGGNGGTGYGAEHDFAFFYDGTTVTVKADDGNAATLGTITTAGWYDFQFLYSQSDSNPTDLSDTTLTMYTLGGIPLGSTTLANNDSTGNPLQNQYLAGPGYDWLTVWQNGFSGDTLNIDDIRADTPVPEPATFALMGSGLFLAGAFAKLRKRKA